MNRCGRHEHHMPFQGLQTCAGRSMERKERRNWTPQVDAVSFRLVTSTFRCFGEQTPQQHVCCGRRHLIVSDRKSIIYI